MNENHQSLHDESDDALDRAIRAAMAQPSPSDVKNRVIETAAAFVISELDSSAARELQVHDRCRDARDALVEEEKEVRSGFEALARSLGPIERVVLEEQEHQSRVRVGVSNNYLFERVKSMILAHKRLSVAAAASVATLVASLILYVALFASSTAAYALEQTAQANDHITSYHAKTTPPPVPPAEGVREAWVELNPDGTPLRARIEGTSGERGYRVAIATKDRAEMLQENNHFHVIFDQKEMIEKLFGECMRMRPFFDPKFAFERLQADQAAGKVEVTTKEPAKEGEPIVLTATSDKTPNRRELYEIDPKTKLVKRVLTFHRSSEKWEQVSQREYLDYNQPIDPKVFRLELPEDVTELDYTKNGMDRIGLAQGQLSDDEIATKLAKECFEAIIAGDWQKVGQLNDGIPGERFKKEFERRQVKFLRIVEIGKPTTVEDPSASGKVLSVPVKVEMEMKGKKTMEEVPLRVRRGDKNSDRWSIGGGLL